MERSIKETKEVLDKIRYIEMDNFIEYHGSFENSDYTRIFIDLNAWNKLLIEAFSKKIEEFEELIKAAKKNDPIEILRLIKDKNRKIIYEIENCQATADLDYIRLAEIDKLRRIFYTMSRKIEYMMEESSECDSTKNRKLYKEYLGPREEIAEEINTFN